MRGKTSKLIPILFIPDVHRPYHDERAWQLMVKVATALEVKIVVIKGDFADFYPVSSFSKDPTRASQLDVEIKSCNEGLDQLDALGATRKVFVAGNHEYRLERYLMAQAPELFNMVKVEKLLNLANRGWEYVPYKSDIKIGKLNVTHDVGASGRNAGFKALDVYQHNVLTGHTHRMNYVVEGNAVGEAHVSAQFGWLGDFTKVDYMHRVQAAKNWVLGFGVGYMDPTTKNVFVVPVPIVKYQAMVNGKLFKG